MIVSEVVERRSERGQRVAPGVRARALETGAEIISAPKPGRPAYPVFQRPPAARPVGDAQPSALNSMIIDRYKARAKEDFDESIASLYRRSRGFRKPPPSGRRRSRCTASPACCWSIGPSPIRPPLRRRTARSPTPSWRRCTRTSVAPGQRESRRTPEECRAAEPASFVISIGGCPGGRHTRRAPGAFPVGDPEHPKARAKEPRDQSLRPTALSSPRLFGRAPEPRSLRATRRSLFRTPSRWVCSAASQAAIKFSSRFALQFIPLWVVLIAKVIVSVLDATFVSEVAFLDAVFASPRHL